MPLATSSLDYVAAIGTAVGALAAAGAVIVALFGPGWQEKRKRPRMTVKYETERAEVAQGAAEPREIRLRIHNERGKATAEAVEVLVTVLEPPPAVSSGFGSRAIERTKVVDEGTLNFDRPRAGEAGRSTAAVPSGHSRPVSFALVGPPPKVADCFDDTMRGTDPAGDKNKWAAISLFGVSGGPDSWRQLRWLGLDETYDVVLVVTGANFDAVTFGGQLRLTAVRIEEEPTILVEWLGPLQETDTAYPRDYYAG
jgi:hypothetical protein